MNQPDPQPPSRRAASATRSNAPLWAALASTLICAGLALLHEAGTLRLPGIEAVELDTVDARFKLRGPRPPTSDELVIVGFDDKLRRRDPEIFQQRAGWARFLDALARYQPRFVAVDAFFASPEFALPAAVVERVRGALSGLRALPRPWAPSIETAQIALAAVDDASRGDDKLVAALARAGNVALAVLFFLDEGEARPARIDSPEPIGLRGARFSEAVVVDGPPGTRPPRAEAPLYASLPMLATATAGAGHVNVVRDDDGKVRRVYAAIEHAGRLYQALGLVLAGRLHEPPIGPTYVGGETRMAFGERDLPVDRRGVATLGWLGPRGTFRTVSAADVLDGTVPREVIAGKAVLVGYTDAARDRVASPFDPSVPGVEVHATLAWNALHGGLMRMAPLAATPLAVLLLGALLTLLQLRRIRHRRAWIAGAGALVLIAGWLIAAFLLFADGLIVSVALPVAALVVAALASTTAALATEGREKARLKAAFSQYVADALVERIIDDPSRIQLGGVRREITVLFSDIRGFSRFAEQMEPEALSAFLNEYLTPMTHRVLDEGGMLDKYIGDAVMGVYGAPLELADHAVHACRSALAMQAELIELNRRWCARGLPEIRIGIGLNSGVVSVGNMGSEVRFDYTVMGDVVNLGARLEALTKEYRTGILCGETTRSLAGDAFVFRELDLVRVKGRAGTVRIFELIGPNCGGAVDAAALARWDRALAAWRAREWQEAEALLVALHVGHPDDGPVAVLLERARALAADPPGADWDGVYEQRSK